MTYKSYRNYQTWLIMMYIESDEKLTDLANNTVNQFVELDQAADALEKEIRYVIKEIAINRFLQGLLMTALDDVLWVQIARECKYEDELEDNQWSLEK